MIPQDKWIWHGFGGHASVRDSCSYRLCTEVGNMVISTIGAYMIDGVEEDICHGHRYETVVFEIIDRCSVPGCGCGKPVHNGSEIERNAYHTAGEARKGHMDMCLKWAKIC